jgi:Conserved TM helix
MPRKAIPQRGEAVKGGIVSQPPTSINVRQPFHGLLNTVVNSAPRILVFLIVLAIGWIAAKVLGQTAQEPAHPTGYSQDPGSTEDYSLEAGPGLTQRRCQLLVVLPRAISAPTIANGGIALPNGRGQLNPDAYARYRLATRTSNDLNSAVRRARIPVNDALTRWLAPGRRLLIVLLTMLSSVVFPDPDRPRSRRCG